MWPISVAPGPHGYWWWEWSNCCKALRRRRATLARCLRLLHPWPRRPRRPRPVPLRRLQGRWAMSNVGTPNLGTPGPVMPLPPRRRRRSFSGPFVLIVVGMVFLLGNLHMLSWMRLGTWFAHYWPMLLIMWG